MPQQCTWHAEPLSAWVTKVSAGRAWPLHYNRKQAGAPQKRTRASRRCHTRMSERRIAKPGINRIFLALAIGLGAWVSAVWAQAPPPPNPPPEQKLLLLVNMVRQNAGLEKLQWDAKLAQAAQAHARALAAHGDLSHQFPGEADLTERVAVTGARFSAAAENVAVADDVEEVHLALMASSGHRANIMSPEYNAVGIAVARAGSRTYVTEDFARVFPVYSPQQFRDGVTAAFNQIRRSHHLALIDSHPDSGLDAEACKGDGDSRLVLQGVSSATRAAMFTANQPSDLPATMRQAAEDMSLRRMNIGVCFRSDPHSKVGKFWVLVAFFQTK